MTWTIILATLIVLSTILDVILYRMRKKQTEQFEALTKQAWEIFERKMEVMRALSEGRPDEVKQ